MLCRRIGEIEVLFYPFVISALDKGEFTNSRPGRFNPWKESRCPLHRRLGGFQIHSERAWRRENILPLPGFEIRT